MFPTRLIEYEDASDEVRQVFDDIMATRKVDKVNNFWKALANHPVTLRRTWDSIKEVMSPGGELDPLTKEQIYIAVSVTNNCEYCIHSHTKAATNLGLSQEAFGELLKPIGWRTVTKSPLINARKPATKTGRKKPNKRSQRTRRGIAATK